VDIEDQKISGVQLTQLMICFICGSNILLTVSMTVAKQDIWLAILGGVVESLVFAIIYIFITKKYPNKTLIEINDLVFGSFLGKLVSTLYIIFFFLQGSAYLRIITNFFKSQIMPETPMFVLALALLIVCAYAVNKGFEVISRLSMLFLIFLMLEVAFVFVTGYSDMKFKNFLPIFDITMTDFIKSANIIGTTHFGEFVVFLMFFALLNNTSKGKNSNIKIYIISILSGGAILIVISVITIALIGNLAPIDNYPYFQAIRIINVRDILTRFEIITSINILAMVFFKICVYFYATVSGIRKILKLSSQSFLVLPIGIIMINTSLMLFKNPFEVTQFATEIFPLYGLVFEVLFPVLILVITQMKKLFVNR